ncbi:MAG: BrxE family protein [Acidobacteriota bacterium]
MQRAADQIDLARLFKLRLVVARFGEMDIARWWNTEGVLGRYGTSAFGRGFPGSHFFAQARVVFAVAQSRCAELFAAPGCMSLWQMPAVIEDRFEERWQSWLDEAASWEPFFRALAGVTSDDLIGTLRGFELLSESQATAAAALDQAIEGLTVRLPGSRVLDDDTVVLLAAGFSHSAPGELRIPYARLENRN